MEYQETWTLWSEIFHKLLLSFRKEQTNYNISNTDGSFSFCSKASRTFHCSVVQTLSLTPAPACSNPWRLWGVSLWGEEKTPEVVSALATGALGNHIPTEINPEWRLSCFPCPEELCADQVLEPGALTGQRSTHCPVSAEDSGKDLLFSCSSPEWSGQRGHTMQLHATSQQV